MMRIFAAALACLVGGGIGLAAGEKSAPVALEGKLTITGSSTVAPLVLELGKRFEKEHPRVRVDVQTGGSSRGISDARNGLADIGMVSRALKSDEKDLKAFVIALDGIGVILHGDNPVSGLSKEQLVGIFSGKIVNWNEVGGKDRTITVVNKAEGRSTLDLFLSYTGLKNSNVKAHIVIGDNEQGIKTVAGNKDAIGYVSVGTAEFSIESGVKLKLLPAGKVSASTVNIKNGSYELSRPLNLVTKAEPSSLALAFIRFAQSERVHDIVKEQYFVAVAPSEAVN